ncbi:MAG: hypothetical protein PHW34_05620 [Hespellia sp.]|nr:hypothetical protein [Hespellia sp.]
MNKKRILDKFVACMQKGDNIALADLFDLHGVLHDSSPIRVGLDTIHLEGRMAVEMMYHHKFGVNGGAYPITSIESQGEDSIRYFITYGGKVIPVCVILSKLTDTGLIQRINIYPL